MALSDDDLRQVEVHAEHALRAADVLAKVHAVHEEDQQLRHRVAEQATRIARLTRIVGQSGQIVRAIDGIYKNPGVSVQRNYEDFFEPELRQLHDLFLRGVL